MGSIDKKSIREKLQSYMKTEEFKEKATETMDGIMLGKIRTSGSSSIHTPAEAADKFINVLRSNINSSGLSPEAIEAISNIEHGDARKTKDGVYEINIYFEGDMERPSLDTSSFGYIKDIVALFNNGVNHEMGRVHGAWHDKEYWSRTVIPGTHFIENTVSEFEGNYATEYNVINISVNGI